MNKPIDLSVLPDGFLIELSHMNDNVGWTGSYRPMNDGIREYDGYRPALNHWHFNDGSMVLPDGLVVENWYRSNTRVIMSQYNSGEYCNHFSHWINDSEMCDGSREMNDTIAVKILGVTAEYGAQLGMGAIEL